MGVDLMTNEQLEIIGRYVKDHMTGWIREGGLIPSSQDNPESLERQIALSERIVRVEEGIRYQGELMQQMLVQNEKMFHQMEKRFELMEKRFEQIDRRFEQVDKRFEQVDRRFEELRSDMNTRFEQIDKRFEEFRSDTNTRFEQVDKRFNQMFAYFTTGFLLIATLMSVYQFLT